MVLPLSVALSLSILYRITINLPDLPYSPELRRVGSDDFLSTSKQLNRAVDELLENIPGEHRSSVSKFSYHQIIGTLVSFDIYSDEDTGAVRKAFMKAMDNGFIGSYAVATDGFEFHSAKVLNNNCSALEFQCSDGTCISSTLRCNHHRDCPDGSDESSKFAKCKHHIPVIYQTDKVFSVPIGGIIHLSAIIDMLDGNHQVIWSRNEEIIGENALSLSDDNRLTVYRSGDEYFLRIVDATREDAGAYKIQIQGLPVNATFEVRITADSVPLESSECPEGERACKSGHCLPVSQFCDRITQCPDGDDEANCTAVVCSSTEFRCATPNVCVPANVKCDGWNDCLDASDEHGCPTKAPHRPLTIEHHKKHSRLTVTCEDGSAPEYSLHGSTYCWSNSVCPTSTACVQGLCCATGLNSTYQRLCSSNDWECLDGTCLDWSLRCNGQADCTDSGDERFCGNEKRSVVPAVRQCSNDEFRCDDGVCVPRSRQCDRHYDCADGSDETKCEYFVNAMKNAQHQPQEQQPHGHRVEQHAGQHHASHQQSSHHQTQDPNVECTDQEFRCPYLLEIKCFHYDKLCDGIDDCGDGSDEVNCESGSKEDAEPAEVETTPHSAGECTNNQFKCGDGRCIDSSLACNHKYDCDDGTDETHCEYFKNALAQRADANNNQRESELDRREEEVSRREQEESRREDELRRREDVERQREETERRREQSTRQQQHHEQEERRRIEEHRRQLEEQRRHVEELPKPSQHSEHTGLSNEVIFKEYDDDVLCLEHEFQCGTGECIDKRRVCDTRPDCLDSSDEDNCSERHHSSASEAEIDHHLRQQQQEHIEHQRIDERLQHHQREHLEHQRIDESLQQHQREHLQHQNLKQVEAHSATFHSTFFSLFLRVLSVGGLSYYLDFLLEVDERYRRA